MKEGCERRLAINRDEMTRANEDDTCLIVPQVIPNGDSILFCLGGWHTNSPFLSQNLNFMGKFGSCEIKINHSTYAFPLEMRIIKTPYFQVNLLAPKKQFSVSLPLDIDINFSFRRSILGYALEICPSHFHHQFLGPFSTNWNPLLLGPLPKVKFRRLAWISWCTEKKANVDGINP